MSNESFELGAKDSKSLPGSRFGWARKAAVVATVAISFGTLGATSSFAAGTTVQAATIAPAALPVPAAPAAVSNPSRLGAFDAALLKLINAKRAAAGAVALREVVSLDNASATWSTSVIAKGRWGTVTANPNLAAQTLAAAPTRGAFAQSVAKWYPQSVKAVDVFGLYTSYPKAMANLMNKNFKFVGIRTAATADGTSVATLTYTDTAVASQIVDPTATYNPTGALTSAVQTGATVQIRGKAADPDAAAALQVKVTDTVGAQVTTTTTTVAGGVFSANVPLSAFGTHTICATVVNQGAGANLSLGCTTARLGRLIGNADTLRQSGNQLTASGWGYDPTAPAAALKATVVVTGPSGTRTLTILSNIARPDVARSYRDAGAGHGYRLAIPTLGKGITTMCVTLVPAQSSGVAKKLACRSITVS